MPVLHLLFLLICAILITVKGDIMKRFIWALRFWIHYAIWHGVTERPFYNGLELYDGRKEGLEWLTVN